MVGYNARMSRRARRAKTGVSSQNGPANSTAVEPRPYAVIAVCGVLLVLVAGVFGQTARHPFVNYDDDQYVFENAHVAGGLTADGLAWAFTRSHASNWHPLTWVSHMADCEIYGLGHPGGHHLTSVALHAATAILLFLLLLEMTAELWPSAFVAALFAVHPLHVESVAWVSERKDVLSGLFFVLTLAAYARYVRRPSVRRYLVMLGAFWLALLSKPMVVTLPLVLLLLDYWPLRRIMTGTSGKEARFRTERMSQVRRLVLEKIPLVVLGLTVAAVTYLVQGTARQSMPELTLPARAGNALVSYVSYLGKFVYPVRLAVFYPHPGTALPLWQVVTASLVLCGISAGVFAWGRRQPYLLVGWLWYLGMLVPVIGLVQVGYQAMADRYTYLPQIGIYMMLAWGAVHLAGASPVRRRACAVAACIVVALLSVRAWRQTSYWRDSEALWMHALASTSRNYEAHHHLGKALAARGESDAAIAQYRLALEIRPDFVEAHNNLANVLSHPRAGRRGRGPLRDGAPDQAGFRRSPQQSRPRSCGARPGRRGHRALPARAGD